MNNDSFLRFEQHKRKLEDIYTKLDRKAAKEMGLNKDISNMVNRRKNNLMTSHKFSSQG